MWRVRGPVHSASSESICCNDAVDMLRTALKAGVGCIPRRAANGSVAASVQAGSRKLSSLQESVVKVTFIDAEVRTYVFHVGCLLVRPCCRRANQGPRLSWRMSCVCRHTLPQEKFEKTMPKMRSKNKSMIIYVVYLV